MLYGHVLETLAKGFRAARQRLTGVAELNDEVIDEALRDVRLSLLEGDVEFTVVKRFLERVREAARGKQVELRAKSKEYGTKSITPEQAFIAICQDELTKMMGPVDTELQWAKKGPTGIMMCGLQGAGKTTTVGKLARWLEKTHNKKPMLVAADVYRPAAIEQLKTLGRQLSMPVFSIDGSKDPVKICRDANEAAALEGCDVVIFDTAGRLAIDEPLMQELDDIDKAVHPSNIFLVLDAMTGQDAVNVAATFNKRLDITGVIMTKLDGDARGGAALSVKEITGKPIKFLGMGEQLDKLEEFRPEGLASRILGMGDIVGLVKDFEQVVDAEKAEEDALRMLKGKFDMQDFLEQIRLIQKMGSLKDLFAKLPMMGQLPEGVNLDDRELTKIEAMISSMTIEERIDPQVFVATTWEEFATTAGKQSKRRRADFHPGRVKRIAKGSGRTEVEVKELLQKFAQMRQMMVQLGASTGLMGKIPGLKQFCQMKKLANMDLGALMGAGGGLPEGFSMPGMPALPGGNLPGMPKGFTPPGSKGVVGQVRSSDRQKAREKRKNEKAARKKSRR
ncbi:signal recognition particle protein [soil metagenome]